MSVWSQTNKSVQPFKRLSFTLWYLQIYWSGIVVILQVKSSTKLQKYTLYFSKCCFKLREFALKVPRYLSNYLLFFVSDTLWKPHGNTFLITKTNICRIRLLHAWISDLVRFLPQCEKDLSDSLVCISALEITWISWLCHVAIYQSWDY